MENIIKTNTTETLTSMEVSEMVDKDHKYLLRDIRRYIKQMNQTNIAPVDFFTESTYIDTKSEEKPCFKVT